MPADLTLLALQRKLARTDDPDEIAALEARIAEREDAPEEPEPVEIVDEEIDEGWWAYTVDELQDELRNRDLPVSGNKAELVDRLEQSDQE